MEAHVLVDVRVLTDERKRLGCGHRDDAIVGGDIERALKIAVNVAVHVKAALDLVLDLRTVDKAEGEVVERLDLSADVPAHAPVIAVKLGADMEGIVGRQRSVGSFLNHVGSRIRMLVIGELDPASAEAC